MNVNIMKGLGYESTNGTCSGAFNQSNSYSTLQQFTPAQKMQFNQQRLQAKANLVQKMNAARAIARSGKSVAQNNDTVGVL